MTPTWLPKATMPAKSSAVVEARGPVRATGVDQVTPSLVENCVKIFRLSGLAGGAGSGVPVPITQAAQIVPDDDTSMVSASISKVFMTFGKPATPL